MTVRATAWIAVVGTLACGLRADAAAPVIADLSEHLIAVTTGFTGTDVLLFGTANEPGDIALVVRGPAESVTLRRKERIAGVWLNGAGATFVDVPGFYAYAGTEGVATSVPETLMKRHQIGPENLRLEVEDSDRVEAPATFRAALIEQMRILELFPRKIEPITVLAGQLFRATIRFPANVPTGAYRVEILFFRDGEIVSAQSTPLTVSKIGFGADVFDFANRYAAVYGIIAVFVAATAGWLASVVFRKA